MKRCTFCGLEPANPTHSDGYCGDCAQESALDDLEFTRLQNMTDAEVNAELIASGWTQERIDAFIADTKAKVAKWSAR